MRKHLYPRLALQNIVLNRRFFVPYLLTILGCSAAYYIMSALVCDPGVRELRGYEYVQSMMVLGMFVAFCFSAGILLYTNSFLMKQRRRELGLWSVLGMGKGNIAAVLSLETLFVGGGGILGGLLTGAVLHKLAVLLLYRMLRFDVPFGWSLSPEGLAVTALLFSLLMLLTLAVNLLRVRVSDPIQLLRGSNEGEREPKTRRLLTAAGAVSLAAGYGIALAVKSAPEALAFYFAAVILVIIGTFCLFTAITVSALKLLRKNRGFYYRTEHFIGISGMLYRMKRNAVGLSNICILSTMVMVMLSGTLSLYLGTGEIIAAQYPADVNLRVNFDPEEAEPFDSGAMADRFRDFFRREGAGVEGFSDFSLLELDMALTETGLSTRLSGDGEPRRVFVLSAADYAAASGENAVQPPAGQVILCGGEADFAHLAGAGALTIAGEARSLSLSVAGRQWVTALPFDDGGAGNPPPLCLIVHDGAEVERLRQLAAEESQAFRYLTWVGRFDLDLTEEAQLDLEEAYWDWNSGEDNRFEGTGAWMGLYVQFRAPAEADGYAMAGGFLFLGILLGLIFLMAAVLIIYYKQISEGYEDRSRFAIMEQVGLTRQQVRRSVRSQVLTVFCLPMAVAAVHILFDFRMVVLLLELFRLRNVPLTALCTLGTVLVFSLVYGAVYLITARTYYKIVSSAG